MLEYLNAMIVIVGAAPCSIPDIDMIYSLSWNQKPSVPRIFNKDDTSLSFEAFDRALSSHFKIWRPPFLSKAVRKLLGSDIEPIEKGLAPYAVWWLRDLTEGKLSLIWPRLKLHLQRSS